MRWLQLLVVACGMAAGCADSEPEQWSERTREQIRSVTRAELITLVMNHGQSLCSGPAMQMPWQDEQVIKLMTRSLLSEGNPSDYNEINERLARLGLMGSWYEITDAASPVTEKPAKSKPSIIPQKQEKPEEWVLWIRERAGASRGRGVYLYRWPSVTPLGIGVPSGFADDGVTEQAVRFFLDSPQVSVLGVQTAAAGSGARSLYARFADAFLDVDPSALWLELAVLPSVLRAHQAGGLSILMDGGPQLGAGRKQAVIVALLEAGIAVEPAGATPDVQLELPQDSVLIAQRAAAMGRDYVLLGTPGRVLQREAFISQLRHALTPELIGKRKPSPYAITEDDEPASRKPGLFQSGMWE